MYDDIWSTSKIPWFYPPSTVIVESLIFTCQIHCSIRQFGLCRQFTYRTIFLPTLECYKDFADVFSEEAFALPPHKAWDHAIELHPDAKLPRGRTFPLSPTEQKELDEFLRENLANGCIHPSKSLIRAPVFFIKKKEGSLCLVQDYQKLNEITIKNSYPLPLVSNILTRLHDAEWFTTLDLC